MLPPKNAILTSSLLEQVQSKIILKEANKVNLCDLLSIVNPAITVNGVESDQERLVTMKDLMLQIHPSNFPDNEDAASIYEDVQIYYDACCKDMIESRDSKIDVTKKRRRKLDLNTMVENVVQFNVRQKWLYLDSYSRPMPPKKLKSGKQLAPLVAYQCINARGAIAHGKKPSLIYSWENAQACFGMSVKEVFDKHGGYKKIEGRKIDEIKIEIITNGPVVSFTFQPTQGLAAKNKGTFVLSRIGKHHYATIVGWKLTEFGEVWLVQNYAGGQLLPIPIGQYGIDDVIVFPKDSLDSTTWQKGPYFDRDMTKLEGWLKWPTIEFQLKSSHVEEFLDIFGNKGIFEIIETQERFVLRDKKILAHSRSCRLQDMKWDKQIKQWRVYCTFMDAGACPRGLK